MPASGPSPSPLTPIRGYAELIARRRGLRREQLDTFAGQIVASTDRLSRVVELLVDVAASAARD